MSVLSPRRVGRVTASRLPAILGLSPYNTRADVMREMVRQHFGAPTEFRGNIATDYGHEHESDAIVEYERLRGVLVLGEQKFFGHQDLPIGATVDGLVGDLGLVEVKCPYRGTYAHIAERPDYEAQIRLQLECTGRCWGDFVVWRESGISVSRVEHDPDWLHTITGPLRDFFAEYDAILNDLELQAEYLAPKVDERNDPEWQIASLEYLEAKSVRDRYQSMMDTASEQLKKLSDGKASKGFGVQVVASERKGSFDADAAKADGVNVDAYRKDPTTVLTVRTAKS